MGMAVVTKHLMNSSQRRTRYNAVYLPFISQQKVFNYGTAQMQLDARTWAAG